jgi:predicted Zn finger-like uncharacterized protein
MLEFHCPNCIEYYRLDDELAGRKVECETCGSKFNVPKASGQKAELVSGPSVSGATTLMLTPEQMQARRKKPASKAQPAFCPACGWKFDADPGMKNEWIGCSGCGEVFQMDPNAGG